MASSSYRDDPEWQAARADYIADGDDHEEVYLRRIEAVFRMREIERRHEEGV